MLKGSKFKAARWPVSGSGQDVPLSLRAACAPARYAFILLLLLLVCGCAIHRKDARAPRAFRFEQDTFAFANELVWEYYFDEDGRWLHRRRTPEPEYTHHCFVVVRSARQFFQNARFDPALAEADDETYRRLIRQVVARDPARPLPDDRKVVIPGYPHLRAFSEAHAQLLQEECGGAWRSYFQRGHWRIVFPFTRAHQARTADHLLEDLQLNRPPILHLIRFPRLSINHAVLVFDAREYPDRIDFLAYDPNKPEAPKVLAFDRNARTFHFDANDYWPGGHLNVYEIYKNWIY